MTAARTLAIVAALTVGMSGSHGSEPEFTDGISATEVARVDRLPIDGLMRVQLADESVYYISPDFRFVFRGELVDLQTGDNVESISDFERINWGRIGATPEELVLGEPPPQIDRIALVSVSCGSCDSIIREALTEAGTGTGLVLVATSEQEMKMHAKLWCAKNPHATLLRLLDAQSVSAIEEKETCDSQPIARAQALAHLLRIDRLPAIITLEGSIDRNPATNGKEDRQTRTGAAK